jgi:hypothetical protein
MHAELPCDLSDWHGSFLGEPNGLSPDLLIKPPWHFFFMPHLLPRIPSEALEVSTKPGEVHLVTDWIHDNQLRAPAEA